MTHNAPMNRERVRDHIANTVRAGFCPSSKCWQMFRPSDFLLDWLEVELVRRALVANRPNVSLILGPIVEEVVVRSGAYCRAQPIAAPVSPNLRDMFDIRITLDLDRTRQLVKFSQKTGEALADYCFRKGIVVEAWHTKNGTARLSNPFFAKRVILQGVAAEVREGHGDKLLQEIRCAPPTRDLIYRALGCGAEVRSFLDAIDKGKCGNFGKGRLIRRRDAFVKPQPAKREHAMA